MDILNNDADAGVSEIANYYAGKTILITGATGFMGKVLVEKLLRSCADLNAIYLLIRTKKGVEPTVRKEQYFKCVIFNKLFEKHPDIVNKVRVIKGDVLEPNLGLSANDINTLANNVQIVFHCAANVRFDQPLRPMVNMNVVGTLKVLQLAEKMSQLQALVHVSTSFCQCNEGSVEERAYPAPQNPFDIIEMVETMDDAALAEITPKLLNGLPNTYAYSKALSEDLICRYTRKLPVIVTRPSIVTAAISEPLPGWIEGVNGPTGLMVGAARGVIRSMHCNPDYKSTVIPVDKAINGMILCGYQCGKVAAESQTTDKQSNVQFCNLCIPSKTLMSWGESIEMGRRFIYIAPLSLALWYPGGSIKQNYYHHLFCVIFYHYLPAYFIDFWMLVFGQKPFLVNVQRKVSMGLKLLQYYTTKDWDFRTERFLEMWNKLNRTDQDIFDTSVSQVNWELYISNYILGVRRYIIGESDDTLPHARKVLRRQYILDLVSKILFFTLIFWFLWTHLDGFLEKSDAFIRSSLYSIYNEQNTTAQA
ncbi:putative fatty acyl-CoA reductase CG5065 [Drosophila grimshawi]|uniref:Fatty acyl-CoA reductase n=1 Tax=Drosophila grimshawi TaxID=7222 RepID=B4JT87_DROGR|nr:putative fatty acyl-CoA reductase CG5065 [Drosophila grimshawi]EDV94977.1 GH23587 [Drosophila grimshawi]